MENYTMGEVFTLPSEGKIYKDKVVNPVIKLRSMTTNDEMKRLSPAPERPYQNMCEIIDDCMVEKCGISSYDMCIGDYQFLLHKLRVVTYGADYPLSITCPHCGKTEEATINLDSLNVLKYNEDLEKYKEVLLPKTKKIITLRTQTPRMMDDVHQQARELKRKAKGLIGDPVFSLTIESLIEEIDHQPVNKATINEFVQKLPMMDTNYILRYSEKINESIGIDSNVSCTCECCGLDYTAPFRITSEFFGPTVNI